MRGERERERERERDVLKLHRVTNLIKRDKNS